MEVGLPHRRIQVSEPSQASAARYAAQETAGAAGFTADDVYRVGLVATELATNLVKHAAGGEMLMVRHTGGDGVPEVEIIAIDRGPGIAEPARALTDGHSTAGSPGTGLGAIRRLSEAFDLHSQPGRGTVLLVRLRAGRAAVPAAARLTFAGLAVARPGEEVCGDAWCVKVDGETGLAVLVDGLGHGVPASEAARAAIAAACDRDGGLPDMLEAMHEAIRHTRGAAGAVARVSPRQRVVTFAGIGNIAGHVSLPTGMRHTVSSNGTLGHVVREFREYSYPWDSEAMLIVHTDGVSSRWSLDDYPGIRQRHPAVVAALLYRDHARASDDAAIVVGREGA